MMNTATVPQTQRATSQAGISRRLTAGLAVSGPGAPAPTRLRQDLAASSLPDSLCSQLADHGRASTGTRPAAAGALRSSPD